MGVVVRDSTRLAALDRDLDHPGVAEPRHPPLVRMGSTVVAALALISHAESHVGLRASAGTTGVRRRSSGGHAHRDAGRPSCIPGDWRGSVASAVAALGHYAEAPRTLEATNLARQDHAACATGPARLPTVLETAGGEPAARESAGATVRWPELWRETPAARPKRAPTAATPRTDGVRTLEATNLARRDHHTESVEATGHLSGQSFEPAGDKLVSVLVPVLVQRRQNPCAEKE